MNTNSLFYIVLLWCMANNNLAAQCNDTIYPSPKRFGNPKYWPYGYRPATGCELAFFRSFHKNLAEALSSSLGNFASYSTQNWDVRKPDMNIGEVDDTRQVDDEGLFYNFSLDVNQGSEKNFFTLLGLNYFDCTLETTDKDAAPEAARLVNETANAYNKPDSVQERLQQQLNDYLAKREIYAGIPNVNIQQDVLKEHRANIEIVACKGAAYAVKIIRGKKVVLGEADKNHNDELHIYIGKWKTPEIFTTTTVQELKVRQNFNLSQPKLSIQNFMLVIKCDASLFDALLQHIDYDSLNKLIMQ